MKHVLDNGNKANVGKFIQAKNFLKSAIKRLTSETFESHGNPMFLN